MSERRTIARPYAAAAFQSAADEDSFVFWSEALGFMAAVASDARMHRILTDRARTKSEIAEIFLAVCEGQINEKQCNFIRVTAENGRLTLLPEIATMYEELRAEHERRVEADVISAFPLNTQHRSKITEVMRERFGKQIRLRWETDPSLLGGIVVRAHDLVIDASVSGWLAELETSLTQ